MQGVMGANIILATHRVSDAIEGLEGGSGVGSDGKLQVESRVDIQRLQQSSRQATRPRTQDGGMTTSDGDPQGRTAF